MDGLRWVLRGASRRKRVVGESPTVGFGGLDFRYQHNSTFTMISSRGRGCQCIHKYLLV